MCVDVDERLTNIDESKELVRLYQFIHEGRSWSLEVVETNQKGLGQVKKPLNGEVSLKS